MFAILLTLTTFYLRKHSSCRQFTRKRTFFKPLCWNINETYHLAIARAGSWKGKKTSLQIFFVLLPGSVSPFGIYGTFLQQLMWLQTKQRKRKYYSRFFSCGIRSLLSNGLPSRMRKKYLQSQEGEVNTSDLADPMIQAIMTSRRKRTKLLSTKVDLRTFRNKNLSLIISLGLKACLLHNGG